MERGRQLQQPAEPEIHLLSVHPDADSGGGRPGENPQRSQPEVHGPGEKSKTSYAKWFPSVEKEAKEWGELRQRLGSGQSSVVSYFLNITAFCKDNNETALEVEQDILNSFRKNGFELISPRFNHMRNFLTCLPFMAGKGLFKQLKEAGVVQRAESFNVANLMPLVADNPLTPAGLLAPTYRNQLAFIDISSRG
ncbi:hypothetical protein BANRA_04998 [Escherichia coli]|nr:hypothetical protein BANRA_04998 [Escherichia coli]